MGSRSDFRHQQNRGSVAPPMTIPFRDTLGERQRAAAQVQNLHLTASLQVYSLLAREAFMGQEVGRGVPVEELTGLAEWSKFAGAVWLQAWGLMKIQQRDLLDPDEPDEPAPATEQLDPPDILVVPNFDPTPLTEG